MVNTRLVVEFCYYSTCCRYLKTYKLQPEDVDFFETEVEEKIPDIEEKMAEVVIEEPQRKRLFVVFSIFNMNKHQVELVLQFLEKEEIEFEYCIETPESRAARRDEIPANIQILDNMTDNELLDWTETVVSKLPDYEDNYQRVFERYRTCSRLNMGQRNRLVAWAARDNAIPTVQ